MVRYVLIAGLHESQNAENAAILVVEAQVVAVLRGVAAGLQQYELPAGVFLQVIDDSLGNV